MVSIEDDEKISQRRAIIAFFVRHRPCPRVTEPIWVYMQQSEGTNDMEWLRSLLSSPDNSGYRPNTQGRRLLQPMAPAPQPTHNANHTRSTSVPHILASSTASNTHRRTLTHGDSAILSHNIWQPMGGHDAPPVQAPRSVFQSPDLDFHPFTASSTRAPSPVFSEADGPNNRAIPDSVARWLGIDPPPMVGDMQDKEHNPRALNPAATEFEPTPAPSNVHPSLPPRPPQYNPPTTRPQSTNRQFVPPVPSSHPLQPPPPRVVYHPFVPPRRVALFIGQENHAPLPTMQPLPVPPSVTSHLAPPSMRPPFPQQAPHTPYQHIPPTSFAQRMNMQVSNVRQGPPAFQPNPDFIPTYHAPPPPATNDTYYHMRKRHAYIPPSCAVVLSPSPSDEKSNGETHVYAYSAMNRKSRAAGARYSIWWGPDDARNRSARVDVDCELDGSLLATVLAVEDALPYALKSNAPVVVLCASAAAATAINTTSPSSSASSLSAQASHHIRTLIAASSAHITVRATSGVSRNHVTGEWREPRALASDVDQWVIPTTIVLDERRRAEVLRLLMGWEAARDALDRVKSLNVPPPSPPPLEDQEEQLWKLRRFALAAILAQPLDTLFSPVSITTLLTIVRALRIIRSPKRKERILAMFAKDGATSTSQQLASQLVLAHEVLNTWNSEKETWIAVLPGIARKIRAALESSPAAIDEINLAGEMDLSQEEYAARESFGEWSKSVRRLNTFVWPEIQLDGSEVAFKTHQIEVDSEEEDEEPGPGSGVATKKAKAKGRKRGRRHIITRKAVLQFAASIEGRAQQRESGKRGEDNDPDEDVETELAYAEALVARWDGLRQSARRDAERLVRRLVGRLLDDDGSVWELKEGGQDSDDCRESPESSQDEALASEGGGEIDSDTSSSDFDVDLEPTEEGIVGGDHESVRITCDVRFEASGLLATSKDGVDDAASSLERAELPPSPSAGSPQVESSAASREIRSLVEAEEADETITRNSSSVGTPDYDLSQDNFIGATNTASEVNHAAVNSAMAPSQSKSATMDITHSQPMSIPLSSPSLPEREVFLTSAQYSDTVDTKEGFPRTVRKPTRDDHLGKRLHSPSPTGITSESPGKRARPNMTITRQIWPSRPAQLLPKPPALVPAPAQTLGKRNISDAFSEPDVSSISDEEYSQLFDEPRGPSAGPSVEQSASGPSLTHLLSSASVEDVSSANISEEKEVKIDIAQHVPPPVVDTEKAAAQPAPFQTSHNDESRRKITTATIHSRSVLYTLLMFAIALTIIVLILASPTAMFELSLYPLRM
ncbi:hypothetical protein PENSPDRAFT_98769 [Peniophora sp. CONT]|nr:hypothetical protein PENSPDRAFT_98769 [Peniophora sp. CONT]